MGGVRGWQCAFIISVVIGGAGCPADEDSEQETDPVATDSETDDATSAGSGASGSTDAQTSSSATSAGATSQPDPTSDESESSSTGGDAPPPPGLPCDQPFEYMGRQACQAEVDGLAVKFFPLDEDVRVQRLAVFLHGDGGEDFTDNWGFREEILEWAEVRDILVVGILSPASYDDSPDPAFGAAQPVHADMVATTLETFIEAYEVTEDRHLYWGVSGGSWFTTSSLIPVLGERVPGIFVANCGGSGVSFGWEWDPMNQPDVVALNSLYLNYGDQDFLAQPSADSYAEYTNLGFVTDQLVHPGATHCDHPIGGPTIEFWSREVE